MDYIDEIKAFLVEGPSQLSSKRMTICRTCEHFQRRFSICGKCGCVLPIKTRFPMMKCPIGKW